MLLDSPHVYGSESSSAHELSTAQTALQVSGPDQVSSVRYSLEKDKQDFLSHTRRQKEAHQEQDHDG